MQEIASRLKRTMFLPFLVDKLQLKISDSNDCLGMFIESMNGMKRNSLEWQPCISWSISFVSMLVSSKLFQPISNNISIPLI